MSGLALLVACSGGDGTGGKLRVGQEPDANGGGSAGFSSDAGRVGDSGIASGENALKVRVADSDEMTIEILTLKCAGDCADIQAIAHGGNPPYTFEWEDGSTTPQRRVCLDASSVLRVEAVDSPVHDPEFARPANTAVAEVTATVVGCSNTTDACGADGGVQRIETLKPDIFGTPTYFAGGAALPAGKYRLTYVDGCLRYQGGGFEGPGDDWDWTVQGTLTYQFLIIGDTTAQTFGTPPSAVGQFGLSMTYKVFDDCVAASLASKPLELDFAGGKLGIWQNDFKAEDNVAGPDGRTPTWELSRVCD